MLHGSGGWGTPGHPRGWGKKKESSKEPDGPGVFVMNTFGGVLRNGVWMLHAVTPRENTQDPFVDR